MVFTISNYGGMRGEILWTCLRQAWRFQEQMFDAVFNLQARHTIKGDAREVFVCVCVCVFMFMYTYTRVYVEGGLSCFLELNCVPAPHNPTASVLQILILVAEQLPPVRL